MEYVSSIKTTDQPTQTQDVIFLTSKTQSANSAQLDMSSTQKMYVFRLLMSVEPSTKLELVLVVTKDMILMMDNAFSMKIIFLMIQLVVIFGTGTKRYVMNVLETLSRILMEFVLKFLLFVLLIMLMDNVNHAIKDILLNKVFVQFQLILLFLM